MKAHPASLALLLLAFVLSSCTAQSPEKAEASTDSVDDNTVSILLLSGQNNHDWVETNAYLQDILQDVEMFQTEVSLTPPKGADAADWDQWDPDFSQYDVILLDYNGEMWPDRVKSSFDTYIAEGGTALAMHASNNPFPGWEAFEQMIGLLWRNADTGYQAYLDNEGELVKHSPGEGVGAGHGVKHDWQIQTRDPDHPIMQGIPEIWLHPFDELYHGQRGPAENMNILASAYSDPESNGTGEHELMVWWIPYGEGKVLTFLPGHHWPEQDDNRAFRCVGFRTLLNRSLEWLATNEVTIPVPDNFPTADEISLVE